jgi:hypothetical protein
MKDEKRFLRRLKRDLKRAGSRRRRRRLKDLEADPHDFDFGRNRSELMNKPRGERKTSHRDEDQV